MLTAATLSIKISRLIWNELETGDFEETFWTDSRIVLGSLKNKVKRFKTFIGNRIQIIKESEPVEICVSKKKSCR